MTEPGENKTEPAECRRHWYSLLNTQEGGIFFTGMMCILLILVWFLFVLRTDAGRAGIMLAVITAHLSGGRASGIVVATNSQLFSRWETIALGTLIEGAIVCLFFSVFCLSFKKLIRVPLLDGAMENVHRSAQSHRGQAVRWGIPGLICFVWFPFLMTGPVVGSVIGYLLGMRPLTVMCVVMFGTVSAIVSWTFIMDQVAEWTSRIGDFMPLLFVCMLLIFIVAFRVKRFRENSAAFKSTEPPPLVDDSGDKET